MNDEHCLMEEKSLLACARVAGCTTTQDGLSSFSKAKVPAYNWLPHELRKKIAQSCQDIRTRQGYPVVDWLRQIRTNCDYCEPGITTQSSQSLYLNNVDYSYTENSYSCVLLERADSCTDTYDVESIKDEVVRENKHLVMSRGLSDDEFTTSSLEIVGNKDNNNKLETSDSENIDGNSDISVFNPNEDTMILTEMTMLPRRVTCCVNLIRDESGYFTSCHASSVEDLPELKIIMERDDNDTLEICQKFLDETPINTLNYPNKQTNTITTNQTILLTPVMLNESVVIDCENNLAVVNVKSKSNMPYTNTTESTNHWTETFNDFDTLQENNECITSDELLYDSCENFESNIYLGTSCGSKIGDSDYKSIDSESSNLPESLHDIDEETTSFDKFIPPIYENWNACVMNGCSLQSLADTRSEFYSTSDFNVPAYDDEASAMRIDDVEEFRRRKGSVASDVLVWKQNLLYVTCDDDEDDMRQVIKTTNPLIITLNTDRQTNNKIFVKIFLPIFNKSN